jgi:hypothetical protein
MSVTTTFASLTVLFAVLLAAGFFFPLRLPKCPLCGGRTWFPLRHSGPFVVYCSGCGYLRDLSKGE